MRREPIRHAMRSAGICPLQSGNLQALWGLHVLDFCSSLQMWCILQKRQLIVTAGEEVAARMGPTFLREGSSLRGGKKGTAKSVESMHKLQCVDCVDTDA
ncbi:unnamed protein product [Effrenium voratum]|uniref:Uncharacterized protein n=1 Tax=Effrenium voratum TaxID=2562239 RepID=A0AA36I3B3_9DINO|nr:unnamed protein product [Effrenium voratum]CAJ1446005.1 unnamed protein product [Effrenium voratum]